MIFCRRFFVLLIILFLSGCFPTKRLEDKKKIGETGNAIVLDNYKIKEVTEKIKLKNSKIENLTSLTRISLTFAGKTKSAKHALVFSRNEFMRLETLNVFSQPLMFFLSNYKMIQVYSPNENTYYFGRASVYNINRLIGINLPLHEVIDIITGNFDYSAMKFSSGYILDDFIYLEDKRSNRKSILTFDLKNLNLIQFIKFFEGEKILEVFFYNYREVEVINFPFKVNVNFIKEGKILKVRHKSVLLNKGVDNKLSEIDIPEGVTRVDLDIHPTGFP